MLSSPVFLPLREQLHQLRTGNLSVVDLVMSAQSVYFQRGKNDHAYREWQGDQALEAATCLDHLFRQGQDAGALMGVLVSLKDLYAEPRFSTYAGSAKALGEIWQRPGTIVQVLRQQLASVVGKTHTVEFAFGGLGTNNHWGTPRNPWSPDVHRVPGGSSSGAGVSIATGTASLALGTDTAGSVRIPAAMTGVAGLKLTAGRWPMDGIVPLSTTLDSPGLLANRVDDLEVAFTALDTTISGTASVITQPIALNKLRLGVPSQFFWDDCEPSIAKVVRDSMQQLADAGAQLVPLELTGADQAYQLFKLGGLAAAELSAFLKSELPDHLNHLDPSVAARLAPAEQTPSWEYVQRCARVKQLHQLAAQELQDVDALLTPTVALTPPSLDQINTPYDYARHNMLALRNTVVANFMGLCGLTMPVGKDASGMPVGLQLLGAPQQEYHLLGVGRAIELLLGDRFAILGELPN